MTCSACVPGERRPLGASAPARPALADSGRSYASLPPMAAAFSLRVMCSPRLSPATPATARRVSSPERNPSRAQKRLRDPRPSADHLAESWAAVLPGGRRIWRTDRFDVQKVDRRVHALSSCRAARRRPAGVPDRPAGSDSSHSSLILLEVANDTWTSSSTCARCTTCAAAITGPAAGRDLDPVGGMHEPVRLHRLALKPVASPPHRLAQQPRGQLARIERDGLPWLTTAPSRSMPYSAVSAAAFEKAGGDPGSLA